MGCTEVNRDQQICKTLAEAISGGKRNFIIYPFGVNGVYTKIFLNERFGIQEKYIIDNKLCKLNPQIHNVEFLSALTDKYTVLLTNNSPDSYTAIRESVRRYVDEEDIVDIFRGGGRNLYQAWKIQRRSFMQSLVG